MATKKECETITIYIDKETLSRVKNFAKDKGRYSRSSAIVHLTNQGLKKEKSD